MGDTIHLFIDPGTNSTGWCTVSELHLVIIDSGTIKTPANPDIWERIDDIGDQYYTLGEELGSKHDLHASEVHFEQMNRVVHVGVIWSIGAIAAQVMAWGLRVGEQIQPTAWQKTVNWKEKQTSLAKQYACTSLDEAAAIGMALHWISKQVGR